MTAGAATTITSCTQEPPMPTPLSDLFESDEFVRRHVGPTPGDVAHMLDAVGADSVESAA